jgi:hypothetical protein
MVDRAHLASAHLGLLLTPVHRALRREVDRQAHANATLVSAAIPESAARAHLCRLDDRSGASARLELTDAERLAAEELSQQALCTGIRLPLTDVRVTLDAQPFDLEVLLWCAAAEIDRSYQTLLAYVQDDWNAVLPTVGFLAHDSDLTRRLERRSRLGRHGLLRRCGFIEPAGVATSETRLQLKLAPHVLAFLTGRSPHDASRFRDPAEVPMPLELAADDSIPAGPVSVYGDALAAKQLRALAFWGPPDSYRDQAVWRVASAARLPLRELAPREWSALTADVLESALDTAAALDACFWLDLDQLDRIMPLESLPWLAPLLGGCHAPILLTGSRPWRPLEILARGAYAEWELPSLSAEARRRSWRRVLPPGTPDIAARFHLSATELRSVAQLTSTRLLIDPEATVGDSVQQACAIVTRKRAAHFATFLRPRRGPESLILDPALHRQVLEVADFFLAGAQVYEHWNFESRITGRGGMRALFAGEPGTGKTLAAEVIAHRVGLPLMKVDLARIVSKWVGETEKSLELVFTEAEESHAVLFLDECDALTGKRGEIRHGADKFANLETAYLLQRLEQFGGLAIMATNLRDQMDEAFQRRFQAVLHFPLPALPERRRLWRLAFPPEAPLAPDIQIDMLASLEMTGAAIVSAACTAALLAANERASCIALDHVNEGIARQFQRESKILDRSALTGLHAAHV